tara:strand:- start:1519 stop:1737 length:219 start_codon:yes stop_codon:yes gene_type:complete
MKQVSFYDFKGDSRIMPMPIDRVFTNNEMETWIDLIINQDFQIDIVQKKLFKLKNKSQLYECIDELNYSIKN